MARERNIQKPKARESPFPAWTPKVCKIMAFMAVILGLGLLFYILLGSRYSQHLSTKLETSSSGAMLSPGHKVGAIAGHSCRRGAAARNGTNLSMEAHGVCWDTD